MPALIFFHRCYVFIYMLLYQHISMHFNLSTTRDPRFHLRGDAENRDGLHAGKRGEENHGQRLKKG